MKWAEISIQTSHEATEAVAEIFHELGASGVLIEDPELVNTYIHSGAWDYTDIPLAEETEVVTVKAWLPTDAGIIWGTAFGALSMGAGAAASLVFLLMAEALC